MEVARNLGIGELSMFSRIPYGGGAAAGTVMQAAMAVATGVADVVVCYRAFNERSGLPVRQHRRRDRRRLPLWLSWYAPFGLMTPAAWVALHARRVHATRTASPTRTSAASRSSTARTRRRNPDAWFYERPITLEDHQASRWIVEPVLRLLDCCQESDGGVALVVTVGRAGARPAPAAGGDHRRGAGRGRRRRDDDELLPRRHHRPARDGRGRRPALARCRDSRPPTSQTAFLYDHFTPFVLMQLEELGFCGRGEAKDFATVERLSLGGELPINTNGGLLGEAYIHGMNGITEAVRQIRGTSCNQVDDVEHVLVTAGTGVPTSGLILAPAD